MLEERVDVLDQDAHLCLRIGRKEHALDHIRANALFIHDVLTDNHRSFLQVFDGDQNLVIYIFFRFQLAAELGNLTGQILDQVRVLISKRFEQCRHDMIAGRVVT